MGRRRGAWAALLLLLPVTRCADFSDTHLYVTPSNTQEAVEIQLDFRITQRLNGSDVVYVQLPKFTIGGGGKTPGENVPRGELILSPSVYFEGQWDEGAFDSTADPFRNTTLSIFLVFLLHHFIRLVCEAYSARNIAESSMVDERFLI